MSSPKRTICPKCLYPSSTCLCAHVESIVSPINVIVLQDPSEVKHHKNTVRLLKLALNDITVFIADSALEPLPLVNKDNALVLYPSADAFCMEDLLAPLLRTNNKMLVSKLNFSNEEFDELDSLSDKRAFNAMNEKNELPSNHTLPKATIKLDNIKHVILLDGSWSKTHKIWSTQTWLHDIPQMTFAELPDSQYRIRKANRKNSLSTLEACAYVLKKLYKVNVSPLYNLLNALQDDWDAHKKADSSNNS